MKHFLMPSLAGALLLSALNAEADISVSLITEAPTTDILASYFIPDGTGAGYQWRNDTANGRRDLGQSFLASVDATLNTIGVQLWGNYQAGTRNADFTVTIWQLASETATPGTSGSQLISTQTGIMPSLSGGAGSFVNFALDDVQLISGNYYLFMLSFDSVADSRNLVFRSMESGGYSDGAVVTGALSGSEMVYTRQGNDLSFYVQATPIPEPGAAVVLLPAAGLVVLLVRRRRKGAASVAK